MEHKPVESNISLMSIEMKSKQIIQGNPSFVFFYVYAFSESFDVACYALTSQNYGYHKNRERLGNSAPI